MLKSQVSFLFDSYELFFSESRGSAQQKVKNSLQNFDVFVACGGDGTVQSIAEVLAGTDKLLGVIPIGSGNDFAKLISSSRSILDFIQILKAGKVKYFDLIQSSEGITANTFGIGFDGLANMYAARLNSWPGSVKYVFASVKALFSSDQFKAVIKIDGSEEVSFHTFMIVVANGKWEGGKFLISRRSDPTDGKLELIVSTSKNKVDLAFQFLRLASGLRLSKKSFKKISLNNAQISLNNPVYSHSDGEIICPNSLFTFDINPSVLQVICN